MQHYSTSGDFGQYYLSINLRMALGRLNVCLDNGPHLETTAFLEQ
jgi:hypothetical protein